MALSPFASLIAKTARSLALADDVLVALQKTIQIAFATVDFAVQSVLALVAFLHKRNGPVRISDVPFAVALGLASNLRPDARSGALDGLQRSFPELRSIDQGDPMSLALRLADSRQPDDRTIPTLPLSEPRRVSDRLAVRRSSSVPDRACFLWQVRDTQAGCS